MPYSIIKHNKGNYSVITTTTGKVHSKYTSKLKAEAQLRLLRSLKKK